MNESPAARPALVLASASPRRRALLAEAGLRFEVASPAVTETSSRDLSIREQTTCNACRKGRAVALFRRDAVVLAADTLVALDGEVIGKPADLDDAVRTLQRLRAREHQVCTAVMICAADRRYATTFSVISHVRFRSLTDEQIIRYIQKVNPLDKAGAYAAQGHGAEIISRIRGSYTNVVGLPMDETLQALAAFGIS